MEAAASAEAAVPAEAAAPAPAEEVEDTVKLFENFSVDDTV